MKNKEFKRRCAFFIAASLLLAALFGGCANTSEAPSENAMEISLIVPGTGEDPQADQTEWRIFRETLAQWEELHPQVTVTRIASDAFARERTAYAITENLPDLFLIGATDTLVWNSYDYLLDLTDYLSASPYADCCETAYFEPFTSQEKIYAFPAFAAVSSVIVYDKSAWAEAGYDSFPSGWDSLQSAAAVLKPQGFDAALALGGASGSGFFRTIFAADFYESMGEEWFAHIASGDKKASFYDQDAAGVLEKARSIWSSCIFQDGWETASTDDAAALFLSGKTPALLCRTDELEAILSQLKTEAPERYDGLGFAVVPVSGSSETKVAARDMSWGLALNPSLEEDTEKLALCLDLAEYLTGPVYSESLAKETGLGGFCPTQAEPEDPVLHELFTVIYQGTDRIPALTDYLEYSLWSTWSGRLYAFMTGEINPMQALNTIQNCYESAYMAILYGEMSVFDCYEDEVDAVMELLQEREQSEENY